MTIKPAAIGAHSSEYSLETAAAAIEKRLSGTPEDSLKPKAEATPKAEVATEELPPAAEVEAAEVSSEPAADDAAPDAVQPRKLKVKLPEGEQEIAEDEVVKGYLRQQDYTRKTQEAAALRKQHEAELSAAKAERLRVAEELTRANDLIKQWTPEEPDWAELQKTAEPGEYAAIYARWDQHKKQLAELERQQNEALARVHADKVKEYEQHLETEREKLFEAIPTWKDEKVRDADRKAVGEFALTQGFTPEDLSAVNDHRAMKVLFMAYQFDKMQKDAKAAAAKAGKTVEPTRVIAPKGGVTPPKDKAATAKAEAMKNLKKTGSIDAAAAAFRALDG
jgi:hypothetical protein